jgi:hypothetical protein
MSDLDLDPYPANFVILSSRNQLLGASNYSGTGLRWCKNELELVKAISETSSESQPQSLCELCAELANTGPLEQFSHQPGYAALVSSSQSCVICAVILASLETVVQYISSEHKKPKSQTVIQSHGKNTSSRTHRPSPINL